MTNRAKLPNIQAIKLALSIVVKLYRQLVPLLVFHYLFLYLHVPYMAINQLKFSRTLKCASYYYTCIYSKNKCMQIEFLNINIVGLGDNKILNK